MHIVDACSSDLHRYQVHGLCLASERPLPELVSGQGAAPDVIVRFGRAAAAVADLRGSAREQEDDSWVERLPNGELSTWFQGVGRFAVRDGREIRVEALPEVDFALVRHLLLGPVLAQVLWQRGVFALHGSVVRIGRSQVAFLGASGEGKSSLAGALHAAGHTLVCDDVAALVCDGAKVWVRPAFPRIRLRPDALRQLGEDDRAWPPVHAGEEKRVFSARHFAGDARPLDRLYVLASGATPSIEAMSKSTASCELMRQTYYATQLVGLFGAARHLEQAARVAACVPGFWLRRPRSWLRMPELVQLLERDAEP